MAGGPIMLTKLIVLSVLLHVLMTFVVGVRSLRMRIKSVRAGTAKMHEIATDSWAWPRRVKQVGNNFDNQFQTPTIWYAVVALAVATAVVDIALVGMSWLFLATRLAHSFEHTGRNDVPARMRIFVFGFIVLLAMWVWFSVRLLMKA
jgi:hypothetical protein